MHHYSSTTNQHHAGRKALTIQTVTIEPGDSRRVLLGAFRACETEPQFCNDYHGSDPGSPAVVTYSDIRLDRPHCIYQVYRTFQNFDEIVRTITVRFASRAD